MLNASVDVHRVLGRLRRPPDDRPATAAPAKVRSAVVGTRVRQGVHRVVAASRLGPVRDHRPTVAQVYAPARRGRSLIARLGHDRAVALAVVGILVSASAISLSSGRPAPNTGGPTGDGPAPRLAIGGDDGQNADGTDNSGNVLGAIEFGSPDPAATPGPVFAAVDLRDPKIPAARPVTVDVEGPFIDDGTLVKPIAVDTVVPDGSALVQTYKVKRSDRLTDIASKFSVSVMSVVWANDLKSKDDIKKGDVLEIPPVSGLIVEVKSTDTLDGIAAKYEVESTDILTLNGLDDPNLVVGQVLILPGARGKALPTPKPTVNSPVRPSSDNGGSGGSVRPPANYEGGKFLWPVLGGGNYISQSFHYGHYGLDIAADYGSTVRAGGAGTVLFAGWKNNGGGYQVWIAHGSGLYTTYNHMSGVSVGRGQDVGRGQQVGRVGQSGMATGPHLHFEVWRGPIWDGGQRVNPLGYL